MSKLDVTFATPNALQSQNQTLLSVLEARKSQSTSPVTKAIGWSIARVYLLLRNVDRMEGSAEDGPKIKTSIDGSISIGSGAKLALTYASLLIA